MSQKESGVVDAPEKKVRTKKEYSAEFIQKTVCDYYRSGTSLAAFCKASNLPYTTVWDWVEKSGVWVKLQAETGLHVR